MIEEGLARELGLDVRNRASWVGQRAPQDGEPEPKTLVAEVRCYIEDGTVNGEDDSADKMLMPFLIRTPREDEGVWKIKIDIPSGRIRDWPQGTKAFAQYKCSDTGNYTVMDEAGEEVVSRDGYVPGCLDTIERGYGDYLILKIDGDGLIQNWNSAAVVDWALKKREETNAAE